MFDNKRQQTAYELLMSGVMDELPTDDDLESYLLGLQRRLALTDNELKEVGYQAVIDMVRRGREKNNEEISQKDEGFIHKAVLRTLVEANILPTEVKAEIGLGRSRH